MTAIREGISNLRIARCRWQEYEPEMHFSLAFASFSMFMRDMLYQLQRMSECSDRCVIFASADLRIPESAQLAVLGETVTHHSDAEMIFGIAEEAGLEPELVIKSFKREVPDDPEKTARRLASMFGIDSEDADLRKYIISGQYARDLSEVHAGAISWKN